MQAKEERLLLWGDSANHCTIVSEIYLIVTQDSFLGLNFITSLHKFAQKYLRVMMGWRQGWNNKVQYSE